MATKKSAQDLTRAVSFACATSNLETAVSSANAQCQSWLNAHPFATILQVSTSSTAIQGREATWGYTITLIVQVAQEPVE